MSKVTVSNFSISSAIKSLKIYKPILQRISRCRCACHHSFRFLGNTQNETAEIKIRTWVKIFFLVIMSTNSEKPHLILLMSSNQTINEVNCEITNIVVVCSKQHDSFL